MIKNKQHARILGAIIGMIMGIALGIAIDNIAIGAGVGAGYSVALGQIFSGKDLIQDKKTRRRVSWSMLAVSILGCLMFGYIVGDLVLGLTAGIGFSFVIGLKWEKLYDERISRIFSKAARNAFVTVNAGLSFTLIFGQMSTPLFQAPFGQMMKYVIYLSWIIFLLSWLYHANYKGE